MKLELITYPDAAKRLVGSELPTSESPGGYVLQTQKTLLLDDVGLAKRFPAVANYVAEWSVKSICVIPLISAHRPLGAMYLGSLTPQQYRNEDIGFLELVAAQVAIAVDNALRHQEGLSLRNQLAQERDRLRTFLDISNTATSGVDLDELLATISTRIRRLIESDGVCFLLPEQNGDGLRVFWKDHPGGPIDRKVIPIEGAPCGEAFRTREVQLLRHQDLAALDDRVNPVAGTGFEACAAFPLVSRNRVLGTFNLGWRQEEKMTDEVIQLLSDVANEVAIVIENAVNYREIAESAQRLSVEKLYLEEEIRTEHNFEEIVGSSAALMSVLQQIQTVAPTDSTVLIEGETGTGKEVLARAIHNLSSRKNGTFVKLNCAAIPTGLLESELFGHEKGAFTGAISQKLGRFELAHNGTLFLDEVGDIPLELQPKLLRVLQEQEFERLGSTRTNRVNVRVIAATNRDLAQMVAEKQFRSDLFYRLNVFPVKVPPLRERSEDIALLTRHFAQKHARRMKKNIETIPHNAMDALQSYRWPGNIRELEHLIERAVIMTRGSALQVPLTDLSSAPDQRPTDLKPAIGETLREATRDAILHALEASNWVVGGPRGAAARLGLGRTTLQYQMRKHGLIRPSAIRAGASA